MTRRCRVINSIEIKDIDYVFHVNKIESGVYSIRSKSNTFILQYYYYECNRVQNFNNISNWEIFTS